MAGFPLPQFPLRHDILASRQHMLTMPSCQHTLTTRNLRGGRRTGRQPPILSAIGTSGPALSAAIRHRYHQARL